MKRSQALSLTVAALILVSLACNAPDPTSTPDTIPTPYRPATNTPAPSQPTQAQPAPTQPAPTSPPVQPVPVPGLLLPLDFETWVDWRRGDQANGTFEQSSTRAYSGQFSGRLQYDFSTSGNDFVVFVQAVPIPGTPTQITVWVYGDDSGHFLNAWINDAAGEVWQAPFGRVDHVGWSEMTAAIDTGQGWPWGHISGPDNGVVDYPIEFYALALDDGDDAFSGSGEIYIDDLDAH